MSIRQKIILLPVAVSLIVVLLMGVGLYVSEQRSLRTLQARHLDTATAWLNASIARTPRIALAQAEVIAAIPAVQKAVAEHDDATLEAMFAPGFAHLKESVGVQQFQFHTPPATSLIRIHKLSKRGDDLSAFRHTVVDANTTATSIAGLERGRYGVGARGVAAIQYGGKHVGTVEIGLNIGQGFIDGFAQRSGFQLEVYTLPAPNLDWSELDTADDMRMAATFEGEALLSQGDLSAVLAGEAIQHDVSFGGGFYAVRAVPVYDYSGNIATVISIAVPINSFGATSSALLTIGALAALAALTIGVGVGFLTGRNIGGEIARLATLTTQVINRDPDLHIEGTDRKDEVGTMTRALATFHDHLVESDRMAARLRAEEEQEQLRQEKQHAREAEAEAAQRAAQRRELEREREMQEAKARAAEAEQEAATNRLREQQDVVQKLAEALAALAEGNLTKTIETELPGQYEELRLDFNRAVGQLAHVVQEITQTAGTIDGEVAAVAAASDDLSRRSERNAATLEQTAAALDQMTASVRSAAQSADEARKLANEANMLADEGSESVARVVEAMARIEGSAQGIAKITTVIDEISFQTNLLALNAGVEAARAGEAGRGFAVVASEVRALAQRSSDAAKEISELIRSSGEEVQQGVDLVGHTGEALSRILGSVRQISDRVVSIAQSASEQATGLAEINEAVNQLDSTTQQNAAMFEETNAATALLSSTSSDLVSTIAVFTVGKPANTSSSDTQDTEEVA